MLKAIEVPPLGEQKQTETLLNAWYVTVGQQVNAGDDIAELVTDKAAFNLPASDAGRITSILIKEGQAIKPGDRLAMIETDAVEPAGKGV